MRIKSKGILPVTLLRGTRRVSLPGRKPLPNYARLSILLMAFVFAATGCEDDNENQIELFEASELEGENEVPPVTTSASGSATFSKQDSSVNFTVTVSDITNVTAAHIHSGAAGVEGPIRVTLFNGPTTGPIDGVLVQGTFTAADVTGITFDDLLNEMRNGTAYVNVHTTVNPDGEIRNQIEPD